MFRGFVNRGAYPAMRGNPADYVAINRESTAVNGTVVSGAAPDSVTRFAALHPAEHAVLMRLAGKDNDFGVSLLASLKRYSKLTVGQIAALTRIAERDAQRAASPPTGTAVDTTVLEQLFATASASGLQYPKLTIAGLTVSRASATGKNPGALYIKRNGAEYLGKVANGMFQKVSACTDDEAATVTQLFASPVDLLIAYGKTSGRCACCNRPLTDDESVRLGIGPVCIKRWGLKLPTAVATTETTGEPA